MTIAQADAERIIRRLTAAVARPTPAPVARPTPPLLTPVARARGPRVVAALLGLVWAALLLRADAPPSSSPPPEPPPPAADPGQRALIDLVARSEARALGRNADAAAP